MHLIKIKDRYNLLASASRLVSLWNNSQREKSVAALYYIIDCLPGVVHCELPAYSHDHVNIRNHSKYLIIGVRKYLYTIVLTVNNKQWLYIFHFNYKSLISIIQNSIIVCSCMQSISSYLMTAMWICVFCCEFNTSFVHSIVVLCSVHMCMFPISI